MSSRKVIAGFTALAATIALIIFVSSGGSSKTNGNVEFKPVFITAGPAGLVAGTAPSQSGSMWLLAATSKSANLQRVRVNSGRVLGIIPLPKEATVVAESNGGYLGIGIAMDTAGAVEILSATGGAVLGTVPVSGRVIDIVAGVDGSTFYALSQSGQAKVLDIVSITSRKVLGHVPLPSHAISVAVTTDQATIYSLEANGTVSVVDLATSRITQSFPAGSDALHICITTDGARLLVLKGTKVSSNVSVIDIATQRTIAVLPAPANTKWIVASSDSTQVLNFVGTSEMGNAQAFLLPS